jgi:signal transduction histidine kinase
MGGICVVLLVAGTSVLISTLVVEPPVGREWFGVVLATAFLLPVDALREIRHVAARPTSRGEPGIVVSLTVGDGLITAVLVMLPLGGASLVVLIVRGLANALEPVRSINTLSTRLLLIIGNACFFVIQQVCNVLVFRAVAGDDPSSTRAIVGGLAVVASILIWNAVEQVLVDWGRREPLRFEEPLQRLLLAPLDLATFVIPVLASRDGGTSAAVGLALSTGIVYTQHRSLRASLAARDSHRDEGLLATSVLDTMETRRRALAMEIHDGPLQTVLASQLELGRGDASAARQQRLAAGLGDAASELRSMARELYQIERTGTSLASALETLADSFDGCFEAGIVVEDSLDTTIPDDVGVVAYQVVHEATSNAARHAGARRLVISARSDAEALHLVVDDDGTFCPNMSSSQPKNGQLGLTTLRSRIAQAGGTLDIRPNDLGGTSVRATLPLDPLANASDYRVKRR